MGVLWQLSYFWKARNRRDESIHSLESGRAVQLYMNLLDCCLAEFRSPCLPQIKGIKDWTENHLRTYETDSIQVLAEWDFLFWPDGKQLHF